MKNKTFVLFAVCLAATVALPFPASAKKKAAADASASPAASAAASASPAASPAKSSTRPTPFHGMATAVDQKGQTFTIAGKEKSRVFKITTNTKITKAGKDATMADIVDNSEISGSYWKRDDGTLEAKTVKIGPMGEKKKAKKEKASESGSPVASPAASPKS